jgi:sulfate transport system permease protein
VTSDIGHLKKESFMRTLAAQRSVMPGFGITLGLTLTYLSLLVLIPLSALVIKTMELDWATFWKAVSSPQVVASYKLSFGASFLAALVNLVFGL